MTQAMVAALLFAVTTFASALFVSRALIASRRLGLLDQTGPRRVQSERLPRAGGPAIFLAFALGVALSYSFDVRRSSTETERVLLLLAGAAIVTGVLLYDDAVGLGAWPKLGWQLGAAALVVLPRLRGPRHGIVIEQFNSPFGGLITLPLLAAILFTLFWIVGMANTLNFVDGIDGLAGSVTLVACLILFAHTYFWPRDNPQFTISLLPLTLAAAILGFLPFNWHPARIIMGDAGAHFLGFVLALIAIIGGAKIATALLTLGLPILDVAWVILYRLFHGRSPLVADRGHLHHRLLDSGWGHRRVVVYVAGTSAAFGTASLLLPTRELKLGAIGVVAMVLLGTVAMAARNDRRRRAYREASEAL